MSEKYIVGIDFGTLSGRAVVVRARDGFQVGDAVTEYKHGVMDETLTAGDNQKLPIDFALQAPQDYEEVLATAIPNAIKNAGVDPEDIVAVGIDATSATVFVTDEDGNPLSNREEFKNNPHAYVKLWKHHGGQDQADRIIKLAEERNEPWLARYGGVLSSELLLPKALEIFEFAPDVYKEAKHIVNLLDWITWRLTGNLAYAAGDSGYKRMLQDGEYPSEEFLEELAPGFGKVFTEKMPAPIAPLGSKVGGVTKEMSELTGLPEGCVVAAGNIDAHVVVAGANAVQPGQLTAILGTSACYVLNDEEYRDVPGLFGIVDGGAVDGLWGYEGGQTAVGDIFAWFEENCVPEDYEQAARNRRISVLDYLTELAEKQKPGEHGLVSLDWFNGNRSPLADAQLSGLVMGMTLTTKPEDIYRALVEGALFGARVIIENFENHDIKVDEIVAAGGLLKSKFFMQTMADITRRPITISTSAQAGALGSAIFAAVAAEVYPDIRSAAAAMAKTEKHAYTPNEEAAQMYDRLYGIYKELYTFFGDRGNSPMHRLRRIKGDAHGDI